MTPDGWRGFLLDMVARYRRGDTGKFESALTILEEQDAARAELRRKGYGWIGLSLLKTAQHEVPPAAGATKVIHTEDLGYSVVPRVAVASPTHTLRLDLEFECVHCQGRLAVRIAGEMP
jgi:hypothetical protein